MGCIFNKSFQPYGTEEDTGRHYTSLQASPDGSGSSDSSEPIPRVGFITNSPHDIRHCNEMASPDNQDDHSGTKHPECHDRVEALWKALDQRKYLKRGTVFPAVTISHTNLDLVHTRSHQEHIQHERVQSSWEKSVFMSPGSHVAAMTAAGSVLELTQKIWFNLVHRGFAVVRPPGHHAEMSRAQGFCLFNNVAIAAQWLVTKGGAKRVAIVDWDVHAGNGQQSIFYGSNQVLTVSIHRYDHAAYYPFSLSGGPSQTGHSTGSGYNINIGWNTSESYRPGDAEYQYAFETVVLPALKQFHPDFILVAAGFDAAFGDPLGGLNVSYQGYEWMTQQLCQFHVPLLLTLEGGYNIENLKTCGAACARALLETPLRFDLRTQGPVNLGQPHPQCVADVNVTVEHIQPYFCLQ